MSPHDPFGTCRFKRGFLFLTDCADVAVAACSTCGRPICMAHQSPSFDGSTLCLDCAAVDRGDDPMVSTDVGDNVEGRRARIYQELGYEPSYDGHHRYYSDADFRTFDDQQIIDHERPAPDLAGHDES